MDELVNKLEHNKREQQKNETQQKKLETSQRKLATEMETMYKTLKEVVDAQATQTAQMTKVTTSIAQMSKYMESIGKALQLDGLPTIPEIHNTAKQQNRVTTTKDKLKSPGDWASSDSDVEEDSESVLSNTNGTQQE